MFGALEGLVFLLSIKNPFAGRRVSFAYLRGGSLANGEAAAKAGMENF